MNQTMSATISQIARYRPQVEISHVDHAFAIGGYRLLFCASGIESLGAIRYRYLLAIIDPDDNEVLHVAAESNDMEGDAVVYLGLFERGRHTTIAMTPTLRHWQFFLPVACGVARDRLGLPYEQYPLTPPEDVGIAAIPGLLGKESQDEATANFMTQLAGAIVKSGFAK